MKHVGNNSEVARSVSSLVNDLKIKFDFIMCQKKKDKWYQNIWK